MSTDLSPILCGIREAKKERLCSQFQLPLLEAGVHKAVQMTSLMVDRLINFLPVAVNW